MNKEQATIFCIGLVNSCGVEFPAKCWFTMERNKKDYFYFRRKKGEKIKNYIGYPPEVYNGKSKLHAEDGKWFVKRQCFETVNASGGKDVWFDNDFNMIKRVSKYGNKQFRELHN